MRPCRASVPSGNLAPRSILVVIAVLATLLAGCGPSITEVMDSWLGSHKRDLLASWGPPNQVLPDGAGGEVWVYRSTSTYVIPGSSTTTTNASAYGNTYWNNTYVSGTATSHTVSRPAQVVTNERTRSFWINPRGIIYRHHWQGL